MDSGPRRRRALPTLARYYQGGQLGLPPPWPPFGRPKPRPRGTQSCRGRRPMGMETLQCLRMFARRPRRETIVFARLPKPRRTAGSVGTGWFWGQADLLVQHAAEAALSDERAVNHHKPQRPSPPGFRNFTRGLVPRSAAVAASRGIEVSPFPQGLFVVIGVSCCRPRVCTAGSGEVGAWARSERRPWWRQVPLSTLALPGDGPCVRGPCLAALPASSWWPAQWP